MSLPQENSRSCSKTWIVVEEASVAPASREADSLEQRRVENMKLLEVATTLTPEEMREFEMK